MFSVHYAQPAIQKHNITFTNIPVKATAMLKALFKKHILYQKFVLQRMWCILETKTFTYIVARVYLIALRDQICFRWQNKTKYLL